MTDALGAAHSSLMPEERLILAATAPAPHATFEVVDADRAITIARRNKVVPQLAKIVKDWPELAALAERYKHNAFHRHQEMVRILRDFAERDIPACPLKGTLLSAQLYGDIAARQSSDIDLLVPPELFEEALAVLFERGYQLVRPAIMPARTNLRWLFESYSNYNVMLANADRSVRIELHWRVTHFRRFPGERNGTLWQRFTSQNIAGLDVVSMDKPDLLLYLAVHGAKDQWRRLLWLSDFATLALRDLEEREAARERADQFGLRVVWETACRLSDQWYGTALATKPRARLLDERIRYLVGHVSLLQPNAVAIPGGAQRYLWNSYDSRGASAAHAARLMLTPNYSEVKTEADFDPALQFRRRAMRRLRRLWAT